VQDERVQARTREPSRVESSGFSGTEPSAASVPLAALGLAKLGLCARLPSQPSATRTSRSAATLHPYRRPWFHSA